MNNWTTFFLLVGVASVSWNLCKLIFWLDSPRKEGKQ
jgi:hypothetical protein